MKVKMAARPVMISCFLKLKQIFSETKIVMESLYGKNAIFYDPKKFSIILLFFFLIYLFLLSTGNKITPTIGKCF
jgi:hypothetical protein